MKLKYYFRFLTGLMFLFTAGLLIFTGNLIGSFGSAFFIAIGFGIIVRTLGEVSEE